jgi:predicted secreted Zn-dependent protease
LSFVLALAVGCGSGTGAQAVDASAPGERVHLRTSEQTRSYSVHGPSSEAIFDFIERNGPTDDSGQRGSGLTAAKWSYVWKGNAGKEGCGIASLTISVDLVVTLPKHEAPQTLTPTVLKSWERFAQDVQSHEQHHVDIYLQGASTLKQRMSEIPPQASCELLEKEIGSVWANEQKVIDTAQEQFHSNEEARINGQRKPLQTQIESNRTKLAAYGKDIRDLDASVASLRNEIKAVEAKIEPLKTEMERIESQYGNNLPPVVYVRYENTRADYNTLIARYNALVDQHNSALDRRNRVAVDYESLVEDTNDLVDTFNWTR